MDMMEARPSPEGFKARVYHSLLDPVTVMGVPYKPFMMNAMVAFGFIFGLHFWYWIGVAVGLHLLLMVLCKDDVHVVTVTQRYLRYFLFYRTKG
jgi:type IV secretory pathway TrbD component